MLITGAMMLAVFTIVEPAAEQGWLAGARRWAREPGALALLAAFLVRRDDGPAPADAAADLPLARRSPARTWSRCSGRAGMFGMFFLGSLYLRRVLGYDPLQIGLAFLPVTVVMGALSVRYSERLVMRFGARTLLFPGLVLIAVGLALFARGAGPTAATLGTSCRSCPARHRRRPVLPGADDAGHVRRHAAGRRAGLRPGQHHRLRSAARLGWPCWRPCRPRAAAQLRGRGESINAALTGGYHLAFLVAAALLGVAIVVALTVLHEPATVSGERPEVDALRTP